MQIDKCGNYVGYENRLEDIKTRYGESSGVYERAVKLVASLKEDNN